MSTERSVERYASARELLAAAEPWLLSAEADNNLLLSIAQLLTTNDHPFREPLYLASVKEGGRVVGCAISAPPDGLELGLLPEGAAGLLVPSVAAVHPALPSVSGAYASAVEFADGFASARGGAWRMHYDWELLRLDGPPVRPPAVPGRLRCAAEADWALLAAWAPRYARAVDASVDVTAFFARMLRRKTLYVWDHGGPRCVVAESGITQNGTRIAAVYTPEEFRGRGYASNAVAAVSERALAHRSKFCVLFAESVPGRLYRRLGYRAVRRHCLIDLTA